jgi:predicted glycogen debranching enzyme
MLTSDTSLLQNFESAIQHEWLETNGLGGWSGSTIIGAHTRRYHGLLVAAIKPPTDRMLLVSRMDETIVTAENRFELGVNLYRENIIHPHGYNYLKKFSKNLFPQWEYEAGGMRIQKTVAMIHGENSVVIVYKVLRAEGAFKMELRPLLCSNGYHSLTHEGPQLHWNVEFDNGIFHNRPDGSNDVYISVPGSSYRHQPVWFKNFQYSVEQHRGLDYTGDLFNHGIIELNLKQGDSVGVIVSNDNPAGKIAGELLERETLRRNALLDQQPGNETVRHLLLAADQFVVRRDEQLKTVIAGYHWFTDWGRDTMISLPGLCLSTGRFDDAKKIIAAFAKTVNMGMLPNRFQDNGEAPEYNNVDGTLWYFIAIHKYLEATGDKKFILTEILPVLKEIIDWHFRGTRYNIKVDADGLLFAGEKGQQLTWMDAKVGEHVVTPRMGKPVEIQALWYNTLKIFAQLLAYNSQERDAFVVNASAERTKHSFCEKFWYEEGNYLYDNIDETGLPDTTLRPNQLFAISLPYPLVVGDKARFVLKIIEKELYTPVGLRTLPADHPDYKPIYRGDPVTRDSCYHQGTVWSWLLGSYIDATVKATRSKSKADRIIDNFRYHLQEGCIGSVSEIFDAEFPHQPNGCVAQAWGVAEILRVIKDYRYGLEPSV